MKKTFRAAEYLPPMLGIVGGFICWFEILATGVALGSRGRPLWGVSGDASDCGLCGGLPAALTILALFIVKYVNATILRRMAPNRGYYATVAS